MSKNKILRFELFTQGSLMLKINFLTTKTVTCREGADRQTHTHKQTEIANTEGPIDFFWSFFLDFFID